MFHFEAIKLISENLRDSVAEAKSGQPGSGREGMALGQYVAGMGFSNVGLGIDHAMAHTLSAHYDTPARRRLRHAAADRHGVQQAGLRRAPGQGRRRHGRWHHGHEH